MTSEHGCDCVECPPHDVGDLLRHPFAAAARRHSYEEFSRIAYGVARRMP
jgi:hypothetical protein